MRYGCPVPALAWYEQSDRLDGELAGGLEEPFGKTVGDAGTYGKPVAWINASGPAASTGAADAHESLRKVLVSRCGAAVVVRSTRSRSPRAAGWSACHKDATRRTWSGRQSRLVHSRGDG